MYTTHGSKQHTSTSVLILRILHTSQSHHTEDNSYSLLRFTIVEMSAPLVSPDFELFIFSLLR